MPDTSTTAKGRHRWRKIIWRIGRSTAALVVIWFAIVWFFQGWVMYPSPSLTAAERHDPVLPPNAVTIDLRISAGTVQGWLLLGEGVSDQHPGPVVMYAHGNGELIDDWLYEMGGYTKHGVSVFLGEYPGYGRSAGSPSEQAIVADFVRWYDKLAARPDVDPKRIVFHGRSLGGGVVAQLATKRKPAAMILQSTFTSTTAVAEHFLVPPFLIRDSYRVLPVVKKYRGPLLIIGGSKDHILPLQYDRQLHAAAPQSELVIFPMGHNDPPPEPAYWHDVIGFLVKADIVK